MNLCNLQHKTQLKPDGWFLSSSSSSFHPSLVRGLLLAASLLFLRLLLFQHFVDMHHIAQTQVLTSPSVSVSPQDFPLLRLDDVVDDQSNILGFSMLNSSHSFYLEFIRSLNLSWREGCSISPYPGPAVSRTLKHEATTSCQITFKESSPDHNSVWMKSMSEPESSCDL